MKKRQAMEKGREHRRMVVRGVWRVGYDKGGKAGSEGKSKKVRWEGWE